MLWLAGRRVLERWDVDLDAQRHFRFQVVVDEHDERVAARLAQLQVVQRQDLVRGNRLACLAVRHHVATHLEHRLAIRVVQPDLHVVRTVTLRRMRFQPEDQVHLRMHRRDLLHADPVEYAEDVQLPVGRHVGVVRQQCELDLHPGSITVRMHTARTPGGMGPSPRRKRLPGRISRAPSPQPSHASHVPRCGVATNTAVSTAAAPPCARNTRSPRPPMEWATTAMRSAPVRSCRDATARAISAACSILLPYGRRKPIACTCASGQPERSRKSRHGRSRFAVSL
jgi:hypothetical protein